MKLEIFEDKESLAKSAAETAATTIREAIRKNGKARIIAATGASQFQLLDHLTQAPGIDWKKVEMFHLDEYLNLPASHPASFRKYLRERLIDKVGIVEYHLLDGERDPKQVTAEVTAELEKGPIDVAFVGIGENGHLAFNDPPADFETDAAYIVVNLDEACRRQQMREGWFKQLDEVPRRALSMTIRQIMKAKQIICVAPDARKAEAVKKCFAGEISPMAPSSILRTHDNAIVYLDQASSSLLDKDAITSLKASRH